MFDIATDYLSNSTGISQKSIQKSEKIINNVVTNGPVQVLYGAIFKKFDKDNSGKIDYNEFVELGKYVGLHLDKEKSLEIFAQADDNGNNQIDPNEFKNAMSLVMHEIIYETLKTLGMTIEDLVWIGVLAFLFLLLLLILIYLGIKAFSQASDFNSIVNSILPLGAGIIATMKDWGIKGSIEKVRRYVQITISKFHKDN